MPLDIVRISDELEALDRYDEMDVSISVRRTDSPLLVAVAVAQANILGDRWWVSRVIVRNAEARGKGLGSIALQRMLAVIGRISALPVYVCPGGYENNLEQQFAFYLSHGFVSVADEPTMLIWTRR